MTGKIKLINGIAFICIIILFLCRVEYFGANHTPNGQYKNPEFMFDVILFVAFFICVSIYVMFPTNNEVIKERYFLIKYSAKIKDGNVSTGNLWFNSDEFPTNTWIKEQANTKGDFESIVVENIFEFKSKEDFNSFNK